MCEFKIREAVLKNGDKITGTVVPISPTKLLLQTDDMCLELSETEIRSLDGEEDFHNLIKPYGVTIIKELTIHQYNEDGSMVSLDKTEQINTSDHIMGKVRFLYTSSGGITKELEEMFDEMEHYDTFGNLLPLNVDKRLENGWEYSVELPVPVPPGDPYEITMKRTWSGWAHREDDHWVTSFHTWNTKETIDHIFIRTLTFMLPEGAEISSATPEPLRQFDFNGRPTLTWRRAMLPKEDARFEARYKL